MSGYNIHDGSLYSKCVAVLLPTISLATSQFLTMLTFFPTFVISAVSWRFILEMYIDWSSLCHPHLALCSKGHTFKMWTPWLRGTLELANFHSHYFSDPNFSPHYLSPGCLKFFLNFSLNSWYFLTLVHGSSAVD